MTYNPTIRVGISIGVIILLSCFQALAEINSVDSIPFSDPVSYKVGDSPENLVAADLNADGALDIVTANSAANTVSVLMNNGDGSFQTAVHYAVYLTPKFVAASDLNGDLALDLAAPNYDFDDVSFFINNGDGTFQPEYWVNTGHDPSGIVCADLDDDGDQDIVVSCTGANQVWVHLNDGAGGFDAGTPFAAGTGPWGVSCADLDGNDTLDLVVANINSDDISILMGNGDGSFQSKTDHYFADRYRPYQPVCEDLDGDGDLEVVVAQFWGNCLSLLENNGDATWQPRVDLVTGTSPYTAVCADLDLDGDLDFATPNTWSNDFSIVLGHGDGTFASHVRYALGIQPLGMACGDWDGDGDSDLVMSVRETDSILVFFNELPTVSVEDDGDRHSPGSFELRQNYPNPFNPQTTIEYTIPTSTHVTVSVYNILGHYVQTLVDGALTVGTYRTTWQGTDHRGRIAGSGVYIYRIQAGDYVKTRRMLLLK